MPKTIQAKRPNKNIVTFASFPKVEARLVPGKKKYFGLFANIDIKKGDLLFYARGKKVHDIDNDFAPNYPDALRIAPNTWIVPGADNPLTYTNHSCSPNAGIIGGVTFRAIKDIARGDEICFDYAISESDTEWFMEKTCQCKAFHCRTKITSIQSLPKKTYNSYLPYIPTWLQRIYTKKQA